MTHEKRHWHVIHLPLGETRLNPVLSVLWRDLNLYVTGQVWLSNQGNNSTQCDMEIKTDQYSFVLEEFFFFQWRQHVNSFDSHCRLTNSTLYSKYNLLCDLSSPEKHWARKSQWDLKVLFPHLLTESWDNKLINNKLFPPVHNSFEWND